MATTDWTIYYTLEEATYTINVLSYHTNTFDKVKKPVNEVKTRGKKSRLLYLPQVKCVKATTFGVNMKRKQATYSNI